MSSAGTIKIIPQCGNNRLFGDNGVYIYIIVVYVNIIVGIIIVTLPSIGRQFHDSKKL